MKIPIFNLFAIHANSFDLVFIIIVIILYDETLAH